MPLIVRLIIFLSSVSPMSRLIANHMLPRSVNSRRKNYDKRWSLLQWSAFWRHPLCEFVCICLTEERVHLKLFLTSSLLSAGHKIARVDTLRRKGVKRQTKACHPVFSRRIRSATIDHYNRNEMGALSQLILPKPTIVILKFIFNRPPPGDTDMPGQPVVLD